MTSRDGQCAVESSGGKAAADRRPLSESGAKALIYVEKWREVVDKGSKVD